MPVGDIVVDPRIQTRHPDVSADSVRVAWSNVVRFMAREDTDPLRYVAVGYDEYGRLLEMVAVVVVCLYVMLVCGRRMIVVWCGLSNLVCRDSCLRC